jgi:hypothetical protein
MKTSYDASGTRLGFLLSLSQSQKVERLAEHQGQTPQELIATAIDTLWRAYVAQVDLS